MHDPYIPDRYPFLLRAMKWVACLSQGEATACLRDYREGRPFSGEAVNEYGGTEAVIEAAWRKRHYVATYYKE